MVLTIAALTKENLQWSSKSKILEKDTHLLKDQLRILNEKYVFRHHLISFSSIISRTNFSFVGVIQAAADAHGVRRSKVYPSTNQR